MKDVNRIRSRCHKEHAMCTAELPSQMSGLSGIGQFPQYTSFYISGASHRSRFGVKDDRVYLQHIRDALDDIATYVSADREAFFAERMRQDTTIRKLQVIGQGVRVIRTPVCADCYAQAERFVRSVKEECLNRCVP